MYVRIKTVRVKFGASYSMALLFLFGSFSPFLSPSFPFGRTHLFRFIQFHSFSFIFVHFRWGSERFSLVLTQRLFFVNEPFSLFETVQGLMLLSKWQIIKEFGRNPVQCPSTSEKIVKQRIEWQKRE